MMITKASTVSSINLEKSSDFLYIFHHLKCFSNRNTLIIRFMIGFDYLFIVFIAAC